GCWAPPAGTRCSSGTSPSPARAVGNLRVQPSPARRRREKPQRASLRSGVSKYTVLSARETAGSECTPGRTPSRSGTRNRAGTSSLISRSAASSDDSLAGALDRQLLEPPLRIQAALPPEPRPQAVWTQLP